MERTRKDDRIELVCLDFINENISFNLGAASALDELLWHHRGDSDLDLSSTKNVDDAGELECHNKSAMEYTETKFWERNLLRTARREQGQPTRRVEGRGKFRRALVREKDRNESGRVGNNTNIMK